MVSHGNVPTNLPKEILHEYSLMSEFNLTMTYHPPGIYVMPDLYTSKKWSGIISVRKGPFINGIFPFELRIPEDFPSETPPGLFLPPGICHPNVNSITGQVDASGEFSTWNPGVSRIYHLLHYFRGLLSDPTVEEPSPNEQADLKSWSLYSNPEAAFILSTDPNEFENRARRYTAENSLWSKSTKNCDRTSDFGINVSGWESGTFIDSIRELVTASQPFKSCPCCSSSFCRGYSWIDPNKMTLFSPERLRNEKTV